MAYNGELKDVNNEVIYPLTKTTNVFDVNNVALSTTLNNINTSIANKADKDANNINIANYHTKLNDMLQTSAGQTQTGQAVVVESYLSSDGKSWYRKYSDNWKECGGLIYIENTASGSPTTTTITLPIKFVKIYSGNASVKLDQSSSGDARVFGILGNYNYGTTSTTIEIGASIYSGSGSNIYIQYEVRGY